MKKENDFYSGFEGEPELSISLISEEKTTEIELTTWIGHFEEIVLSIGTNDLGKWEGISLYYHLHTGWYDQSPWILKEVDLFAKQLKSIENNLLSDSSKEIHKILSKIITKAVKSPSKKVVFNYS